MDAGELRDGPRRRDGRRDPERRKKLIEWARWCFADKKFDCDLCRLVQRDRGAITCHGIDTVARCPEGKIPHLDARNRETWALFNEMLLGLLRPGGGYDYGAVRDVLDIHQVSAEAQRHLFPTLVNIIEVFEAARRTRGAT